MCGALKGGLGDALLVMHIVEQVWVYSIVYVDELPGWTQITTRIAQETQ